MQFIFLETLISTYFKMKNLSSKNTKHKSSSSAFVNKYKEICQTFSLTKSLLDHILTNSSEKVSQKGVLDVGISDHQLIC